ncbi:MAG TPA: cofactor-independent phosphoglycerate mutase [Clostridiales bacterium]|nr:cofactor-independent phosphoglycerate mutase [Clostridiales bacterium]
MKYLILVPDGAGDEPLEQLKGRTPLEAAKLPNINRLAAQGLVGMVRTVPEGMAPGSDTANLSVMGFDPRKYHTGRSPLEAASIGIDMADTDVAFRCNLVTLSDAAAYDDKLVLDHSAGEISTAEADELIKAVNETFGDKDKKVQFYTGTSYRHAMIVKNGETNYDLTPPHDILERRAGDYLPKGEGAGFIEQMMRQSYSLLENHPVNQSRRARGLKPANSIWIWGQGRKPALDSLADKYKVKGATISAVDLIKGIGILAGVDSIDVPGATGTIDTNYEGKTRAAIELYEQGYDFVYMHLEGPDECSHQGDLQCKITALERIDERIVAPLVEYLESSGQPFRILIVPDHQTPLRIRTHAGEPVPFVFYDSEKAAGEKAADPTRFFGESSGEKGLFFDAGYQMTDWFFGREAE